MSSVLNRNLLLFGPYKFSTGYDMVSRNLIKELYNKGLQFRIQNHNKWAPESTTINIDPLFATLENVQVNSKVVLSLCLHEQQPITENTINAIITMFETTQGISPQWVEAAKQTDCIIVPNKFNKDTWVKAGVPSYKIRSITLGIDHNLYNLNTPKIPFLVNGQDVATLHKNRVLSVQEVVPRKNIENLLESWVLAFPKDDGSTCLILKANSFSLSNTGKVYKILRKIRNKHNIKNHAPVYVYSSILEDDELAGFLANGTHYFSMSHGEAVDMSMLQMGAMGATLVVPNHTGYRDYLKNDMCYFIDSQEVPVKGLSFPIRRLYANSTWQDPLMFSAIRQLREAVKSPIDRKKVNDYMQQYTWGKTADQVVSILEDLVEPTINNVMVSKKEATPLIICPSLAEKCGIAEYTKEYSSALSKITPNMTIGGPNTFYRDFLVHPGFNTVHIMHEYQFFNPTRLKFIIDQSHKAGKKVIVTQHTLSSKAGDHNEVMKSADGIIVHSEYSKDYAVYKMGYSPLKVFVAPMGIGNTAPAAEFPKEDNDKLFVISYFGLCYFHKNLHTLITTYKELKEKHPQIHLLILSSRPKQDTYYFDYCKKLASGIPDIVWYDKYLDDLQVLHMLSISDLQIFNYDDYGSVGTSAAVRMGLRAQKPLLVNDTCWFSDIPSNVAPRISTAKDLYGAISNYLHGYDFSTWTSDIKQYVQDHNWSNVVEKHKEVYDMVLKK